MGMKATYENLGRVSSATDKERKHIMTADACASDYVILILSKYMGIFVYPLLSVVDKDSVVYCLITVW